MSRSKHVPALDGARGMAVLLVMLVHLGGGAQSRFLPIRLIGLGIKTGWTGVMLFFVLSGFLITGILWDSKSQEHWWRNFYMRRVLRIFPLYYWTLLIVLGGAAAVGMLRVCLSQIWVFGLYLQNVPWLLHTAQTLASPVPMGHFWSLAVEEQFYLIWPFLLLWTKTLRQAKTLCLSVFLLSALFRVLVWTLHPDSFGNIQFLPTHAGELAMGGYLAIALRDGSWMRLERWATLAMVLSFSGFVASCYVSHDLRGISQGAMFYGLPCLTIFYAGLLVQAMGTGVWNRLTSMAWLRWVGSISYGLYVYHVVLIPIYPWIVERIAPHAGRNTTLMLDGMTGFAVSFLVAWLSFRFFETPFLRLKRRYKEEERTAAQVERFADKAV